VELGIIPLGTLPVMPVSGFAVYDTELVLVETLTGETAHQQPGRGRHVRQGLRAAPGGRCPARTRRR